MSVFLIDTDRYIKLANTLGAMVKHNHEGCEESLSRFFVDYEPYESRNVILREDRIINFVNELMQANKLSYWYKYKEPYNHDDGDIIRKNYKTETETSCVLVDAESFWSRYQVIKTLACVRYNIEVAHESSKMLDGVIQALCFNIIQDLPQYEESEWG
tara:strand:- start:158 stop:631 length:474 start_codon:yes stop_codon:yes gene_type:complete